MLKPVSETILNQMQDIYSKRPWLFSLDNWREKVLSLLNEPEFSTNPKCIKYLFELVLDNDQAIAEKAVMCIKASLSEIHSLDWIALSEDIKGSGYYGLTYPRKRWFELTPKDVSMLKKFKHDAGILIGLVSFHNNGYVREEALHQLHEINNEKEILFLLLRLNDWVRPVRKVAEDYFLKKLDLKNINGFLKYLPLVYHLANCFRQDHKKTIEKVENFLERSENKNLLLEALKSDDRYSRRICYKILIKLDKTDTDIILAGLSNNDSIVQRIAIKNVVSIINVGNGCSYFELFKKHKFSNIRKYAPGLVNYCSNLNPIEELKGFLLDESSPVRDIARFYLGKNGFTDFRELYINNLATNNPHLYAAICGLGEVGNGEDDVLVIKFINLPQIKITKAVLRVLSKLNAQGNYAVFMNYLDSVLVGVSKEARRGLEACIHLVDEDKLWSILDKDIVPVHVFENVVTLFIKLPKWKSLVQLLTLFKLNKPDLDKRINLEVRNWIIYFNRSFVTPTIEQQNKIEQLYNLYRHKLSVENNRELKVLLRT